MFKETDNGYANWLLSARMIPSLLWNKDLRQVAIRGPSWYRGRLNTVSDVYGNLRNAMGCIGEVLGYLLRFVSVCFQRRASVAAIDPIKLISAPILGGLHHRYPRVAA